MRAMRSQRSRRTLGLAIAALLTMAPVVASATTPGVGDLNGLIGVTSIWLSNVLDGDGAWLATSTDEVLVSSDAEQSLGADGMSFDGEQGSTLCDGEQGSTLVPQQ